MVNIVKAYHELFLHKLMKLRGFQEKPVEVDPPGTTLNFWVLSKPNPSPTQDQPALVLLHGFAANGILTWQLHALFLAKHYPMMYIPDLLFFGRSTTRSPERSPKFQGDCLAKALRLLGVKTCILVGFSYGGMVGFEMARCYPELVVGMVVTGAVIALLDSISGRALERIGFSCWSDYLIPDSVEGVKVLLDVATYKLPWLPSFFYKHFLEEMYSNRKERDELLKALVKRDEDVIPHHFQQRIHILWGESDKIISIEEAKKLKEKLGSKTILNFIEKAGHLCLMERPFLYNKYLKELLATLS